MKQKGIRNWLSLIHNCFANAQTFLLPFSPIKSIGDALMFYIEASDLGGHSSLQIFDGLWQIANDSDPIFPIVKIGAARCEEVYPITFFQGNQDYYGIDIDLTARLQSEAREREVVIERRFYDEITANYREIGNQDQFVSYHTLSGPVLTELRGIQNKIEVFRTNL